MRLIDVDCLRVTGWTTLGNNNIVDDQSSVLSVAIKHDCVPLIVAVRLWTDQKGRSSSAVEREVKLLI